jgi:glycosyltransferase involved in cell wall biosynthesis
MISGGADENTLFTIKGLDKDKYEIDLITGEESDKDFLKKIENLPFNTIIIKGLKWKLNFFYDPGVFLKLVRLIKNERYDIVHTHTTKAGILGRIAAFLSGVPIIVHGLHGSTFQAFNSVFLNKLLFLFERFCSRFTDAYISVSTILSQSYIDKGIGKKDNHFTVYSGMELSKFFQAREQIDKKEKYTELKINEGEFIIGNVARLEMRKGHYFLIDAFQNIVRKYKHINVKLLIVGEGNKRIDLEKYVKELDLEDKVIFTGYRKNVEELMALMDVFVLTSLREGLPRVLVQAAAVGIPSIAFNVDGVPEIIKDNHNGFLVEAKNLKLLENRILKYMEDKELAELHGQQGRELVGNKWSIDGMIQRTDKIYQKLISEKYNK